MKGNGLKSDIAVDDIEITQGACDESLEDRTACNGGQQDCEWGQWGECTDTQRSRRREYQVRAGCPCKKSAELQTESCGEGVQRGDQKGRAISLI